jgi:hypothetical protein
MGHHHLDRLAIKEDPWNIWISLSWEREGEVERKDWMSGDQPKEEGDLQDDMYLGGHDGLELEEESLVIWRSSHQTHHSD